MRAESMQRWHMRAYLSGTARVRFNRWYLIYISHTPVLTHNFLNSVQRKNKAALVSSPIMQIFHDLITFAILGLSLVNALVASQYDCGASPTEFNTLSYEFWIEVEFLEPVNDQFGFRSNNPVHIQRDHKPFNGVLFDRPIVARTYQVRDLFLLQDQNLLDPDGKAAVLWPDSLSTSTHPGYNPLVFNPTGDVAENSYPLDFTAVKTCTRNFDTELRLIGGKRRNSGNGVVFRLSPSCHY